MLVGRAEQADLTEHESTNPLRILSQRWTLLEHTVFGTNVIQKVLFWGAKLLMFFTTHFK